MILNSPYISGSLTVTGNITACGGVTISGSIASASYAVNSSYLNGSGSGEFVPTGSFNTASGSFSTRISAIEGKYITTGSNTFIGNQTITGSILQSGSLSVNGCIVSTGQIVAQTINVQQVTSSIVYSCGSNIFGCAITDTQQMTGSVRITGSFNSVGVGCFSAAVCAPTFIGTTNINTGTSCIVDSHMLNVNGDQASVNVGLVLRNTNATYPKVYGLTNVNNNLNLYDYTANSQRLRIDTNGIACFACQVCVPSLIASSADTTGTNIAIVNTSTGGTYWNLFSGGSAASLGVAGSLIFRDSTNGATRMVLTQGGNLGIGCNSPSFKLDAYSSAAGTATVARFGAANYGNPSYKTYIQIGTQYLDGSSRIGSSNPSGNLSELFFETADSVSGNFNERLRISSSGISCFQNVVCACSFASATPSLTRTNLNIDRATKIITSFNATASGARWLRVGCFDARTTYLMSFGTTGNYYTPGSTTFLMFRDWGNGFFTSTLGKLGEQYVFCARMQSDNVGSQYALEVWMNSITADQLNGVLVYSAATLAGNPDNILMCLGSYGTSLANAANTSTAIAL